MNILDNGDRRVFSSGAVRDIDDSKGRVDLMPIKVIGDMLNDPVLIHIGEYVYDGDIKHLERAIREFSRTRYESLWDALLDVSIHYRDGSLKYAERNWEKGINLHSYIDSGCRHYLKVRRGDLDEPHDRAFLWNMLGAIWTQENRPECIDLPFARKENNNEGINTIR